MDPISQGTVGAAFAQSAADKKNIGKIMVKGNVGYVAWICGYVDFVDFLSSKDIRKMKRLI